MSLWFLLVCHCKNQEQAPHENAVIKSLKICTGDFPCFRHISSIMGDAWGKKEDEIQSMLIRVHYFGKKRHASA